MLIGHTTYLITKIRGGSILVIFVGKPPPINCLHACNAESNNSCEL